MMKEEKAKKSLTATVEALFRVLLIVLVVAMVDVTLVGPAMAETWQMKQRDMHNVGRAGYTVPEARMNDTFFF